MRTRSVDENREDPFKNLEPPKPMSQPKSIADVRSALNSANNRTPVEQSITIVESEKNAVDLTVNASNKNGPDWIRQDLTSLCVPYNFKEVYLRTVSIPVLALIHAAKQNRSYTMLIDAMDHCIDVDVRLLTPQDFKFVMHWVKNNSYPKSPTRVNYITRYGNEQEINIRNSHLQFKELDMTREEYAVWRSKGIVFPTMRDAELLDKNKNVAEDLKWQLEYAQYVEYVPGPGVTDYSDYTERKLARLNELGIGIIEQIDEFSRLIDHGVDETVTIVDKAFDPLTAASFFEKSAKETMALLNGIEEDDIESPQTILMLGRRAQAQLEEAKELRRAVANGESPRAKEETVAVEISATDFFPGL